MEETGKNPIQVAARLFQVIELLAEHGPMGIMEISASLGFHKSTVHRLVSSLQQLGYIRQDEETMKYGLSLKFLEISGRILAQTSMASIAHPYLKKLSDLTGETGHLVRREGRRQFRIHHRKTAPVERCVDSRLLSDLLIGQHRRITHLASCRRDGQNCRNRKRSCQRHFSDPDIPEFLLRICRAMGDRFCCIDRASASYRQNKVRPKSQRLLYAFLRKRKAWIWFDSAEFFIGDPRLRQRLLHPPDQAAADGASATVNQKHSASSPFLYFLTRLIFCSFSKDYFCWCILYKIFHRFFFLSYLFHFRLKRKSMFKHDNHSTG